MTVPDVFKLCTKSYVDNEKIMHAASIKFSLIPPRCSKKISFFNFWTLSQFIEFSESHLGKIQVDQFEKHRLKIL